MNSNHSSKELGFLSTKQIFIIMTVLLLQPIMNFYRIGFPIFLHFNQMSFGLLVNRTLATTYQHWPNKY